jgi:pyruvate formate lyase activating enzyme
LIGTGFDPGALAYSFGMLGCDLHCGYCQNWVTSQALRDPAAAAGPMRVTPAELVLDALRQRGRVIVSTYNEPLITSEWAMTVFREARAAGLVTGFVSNGNGTLQVLEYLRPWVDLYKVDLKSFDDHHYRQLGGRLQPILDTIRQLHEMGFWLEIVTLVIPGFNDSGGELTRLAEFLAGVSLDIPWHVTAFHKDYKMLVINYSDCDGSCHLVSFDHPPWLIKSVVQLQFAVGHVGQFRENDRKIIDSFAFQRSFPSAQNPRSLQ